MKKETCIVGSLSGEYGRKGIFGKSRHHSETVLQGNTIVRTKCMCLTALFYMAQICKRKIPAKVNPRPEFLLAIAYGGSRQWQVL